MNEINKAQSGNQSLRITLLSVAIILAIVLVLMMDRSSVSSPVGKPAAEPIAVFLPEEEMSGETFVILSDMYDDECNERHTELLNVITHLNKSGVQARMLHAGKHGYPAQSFQQELATNRGAPKRMILADSDVLYADRAIRKLPKPAVVTLVDGVVTEIRSGEDLNQWVRGVMSTAPAKAR
ncbi:MAG: hypothetical protein AAFX06_07275 [Planctomycetota bacterium]